jgi:hypothetical protein
MKRVFLVAVVIYAALLLVIEHWPNAINAEGIQHSAPWMILMVVDGFFAVAAVIKMFPHMLEDMEEGDEDEDAIHTEEVNVPDVWFYGLVGIYLVANLGWHGYEFGQLTGAASFYYSLWFIGDLVGLALTFLFFKHAQASARRAARKARAGGAGPRPVGSSNRAA